MANADDARYQPRAVDANDRECPLNARALQELGLPSALVKAIIKAIKARGSNERIGATWVSRWDVDG
jgi:hypothetical protein